jgi:hypothetical protein
MTKSGGCDSVTPLVNFRLTGLGLAVALVGVLGACSAGAQAGIDPVLAARSLGYDGIEAYQAGNYTLADQKLSRAYQLLPVPTLGMWSARALVQLNFLLAASQRYRAVIGSTLLAGDAAVQRQAKEDAARELAELLPRIPSVLLRLEGAVWDDVSLTVDGVSVRGAAREAPILVNPGVRFIEGQRGQQRVSLRITALPSQHGTAVLDFTTPHAGPAPHQNSLGLESGAAKGTGPVQDTGRGATWRTVGWVAVGVGGSALLLSGVTGLVAWGKLDDFDCHRSPCSSDDQHAVDTYNSLVTASTVGYLAGGLVAGAGALLLLRYRAPSRDVTVGVSSQALTLSGRF